MYPVTFGFDEVNTRLDALARNDLHAEALLAGIFAFEKSVRRALRYCALNRGFTSKQCDDLFANVGFRNMVRMWPVFEKNHRTLQDFVGSQVWQHVPGAVTMRNKMVHGARVYSPDDCKDKTASVRKAIEAFRDKSISELGCDPWSRLPGRRKSSLGWLGLKQPKPW